MLTMNLKSRMKNEAFWLGTISWIILIAQLCGFDATTIIPKNYVAILNGVFGFLGFLGVAVDTSTKGVSDQITAEVSILSDNNEVIENSQESTNNTLDVNAIIAERDAAIKAKEVAEVQLASIQSAVNGTGATA